MLEWFKDKRNIRRIGRWFGWVALALLAFTMLTGYGISQFRIVNSLTFGLLDKASSHKLHYDTDIPLVVFALAHVTIAVWGRWGTKKGEGHAKSKPLYPDAASDRRRPGGL